MRCPTCSADTLLPGSFSEYEKTLEQLISRHESNDIPETHFQRSQFDSDIESVGRMIQRYDEAIVILEKKRKQLQRIQDLQKSLLSPIRRLPPDILTEIFDESVGGEPISVKESFREKFHCTSRLFRLMHIWSPWRVLILSRPSFWSSIKLSWRSYSPSLDGAQPMLEEYFLRAGPSAPLTLEIFPAEGGLLHPQAQIFLDTLISKYASRWRRLDLQCTSKALAQLIFKFDTDSPSLIPTRFPSLEVLSFNYADIRIQTSLIFSHLYSLQILVLHAHQGIYLGNLTCLDISRFIGRSFAVLLNQCPFLQKLSVFVVGGDQSSSSSSSSSLSLPECHHHHLSTLHISALGLCSTDSFENLQLPRLSCLEVINNTSFSSRSENNLTHLKEMLKSSQCVLRKVELSQYPPNAIDSFLQDVCLDPNVDLLVNKNPYYTRPAGIAL